MPKDKTKQKARNELPLEKRFQIVEYENSKGLTGVRKHAEKFGRGKTQVINILNQKTLVREEYTKEDFPVRRSVTVLHNTRT